LGIPVDASTTVVDAASLLSGGLDRVPEGPVLVHDPIGGPIGVGIAEWLAGLGREVALVTPDQIAGTLLSLSGDLADANTRLARAGVRRELRARFREVADGQALLEDVWTGEQRPVPCAALVDCSHRVPDESLYLARPGTPRAGDCVAPRSVLEAVLEGRRRALEVSSARVGNAPLAVTGAP
jgi:2,4-dienoyl-CoA reductase (NADPH2)